MHNVHRFQFDSIVNAALMDYRNNCQVLDLQSSILFYSYVVDNFPSNPIDTEHLPGLSFSGAPEVNASVRL